MISRLPRSSRARLLCLAITSVLAFATACSDTDSNSNADAGQSEFKDGGNNAINNLSVVPNPSNALSVYVEWQTDTPSDTSLDVSCGDDWEQSYQSDETTTDHRVFVMGLWDGAQCDFTATSTADAGSTATATTQHDIGPLPDFLPEMTVHTRQQDQLQPGWTMVNLTNTADSVPFTAAMIDNRGRYRWYHQRSTSNSGSDTELRPMDDGVLMGGNRGFMSPKKIDWQGNTLWSSDFSMHHDIRPVPGENAYYYLTDLYGECDQDVRSGALMKYNVDQDATAQKWVLCDYWVPSDMLTNDDWSHLNTIEPFPDEQESFILSSRTQHTLIKLDAANESVEWTMGVEGEFDLQDDELFFRQHAPEIQPNGNILLFDNGAFSGGEHSRPWSRAVEISYDTDTMSAEVVWEFRPDPDIFAPIWSDADRLDNGNTLVTFGLRNEDPDNNSSLMEVTSDSQKIWDVEVSNTWGWYRADRVVDLPVGSVVE